MTFTKYLRYSKCIGKSLKVIKLVFCNNSKSVQLNFTENQISNNKSLVFTLILKDFEEFPFWNEKLMTAAEFGWAEQGRKEGK